MVSRSFRSWLVLALLCSTASALPASADAVRAKKGRASPRVEAPRVISVLSATHPQLAQESMAAGSLLRVTGVGSANRLQMERVFYRAFAQLMPSNATFALARTITLQAAQDLYGTTSAAYAAVRDAWTAVGVN